MQKAYTRIVWENYPSLKSALNETNLNKMDGAMEEIDNRVVKLDNEKLDKVTAYELVKAITFNEANGVLTITYLNGSQKTIDTKLEKLAVNFRFDPATEQLIITLDDGTEQTVDLSALITQYEFLDSDTVAFEITEDGKVNAIVKEGSIQERHLRPDYLADIKIEQAKAKASADAASVSEMNAAASELLANQYKEDTKKIAEDQQSTLDEINKKLNMTEFDVDNDGNLIYTDNTPYIFSVDANGDLNWEVA